MAKKQVKNKVPSARYKKYKDGKASGFCPKCGPGIFLAKHKDRQTCGKCAYVVISKKE
jgi:ubiquitin-small subunit ribosomal protein S27Ae